jgi:hypothetical protein
VNAHCATEEAAVTGLERVIDFVMHDGRLRFSGLRCVPLAFGIIKPTREHGFKPPLPNRLLPGFA